MRGTARLCFRPPIKFLLSLVSLPDGCSCSCLHVFQSSDQHTCYIRPCIKLVEERTVCSVETMHLNHSILVFSLFVACSLASVTTSPTRSSSAAVSPSGSSTTTTAAIPWCVHGASPNQNLLPVDYCNCGHGYSTTYSALSSGNPCP